MTVVVECAEDAYDDDFEDEFAQQLAQQQLLIASLIQTRTQLLAEKANYEHDLCSSFQSISVTVSSCVRPKRQRSKTATEGRTCLVSAEEPCAAVRPSPPVLAPIPTLDPNGTSHRSEMSEDDGECIYRSIHGACPAGTGLDDEDSCRAEDEGTEQPVFRSCSASVAEADMAAAFSEATRHLDARARAQAQLGVLKQIAEALQSAPNQTAAQQASTLRYLDEQLRSLLVPASPDE